MGKVSIFFMMVFISCVLEQTSGYGYYWQGNPASLDFISYPYLSPVSAVWQPDCDKNKESSESSESSSSESSSSESSESEEGSSSSSSSSSSSESESKGSKESGESKESSESSSSSEESKGSGEGSKESKESKESKSSEGSSEGSKEKKEAPKKKKKKETKSLFPPRSYIFPPRQGQRIIYSPAPYMPYKSSYIVQQPVASYPVKSGYQYIPASTIRSYASSPIQQIVYGTAQAYAPAPAYAPVAKSVLSPGARVIPGSWNSGPIGLWKK